MAFLKSRKNKRYNYTPRFYKQEGEGSPFEIKSKFDDQRRTVGNDNGFKNKFNNALDDYKTVPNQGANNRVFIIVAVLILVFLFIIDFDLTIFFPNK